MEVLGLEPSEYHGRQLYAPMLQVTLENFDTEEKFDLVLAMNVLEHVCAPRQFLETLTSLVRPEGFLYVEVPSAEYLARASRLVYGQMIQPGHLYHFLGTGIASALSDMGMTVIHQANSMSFDYPSLQILARKMGAGELGRQSFLEQVAQTDARLVSAAQLLLMVSVSYKRVILWGAGTDLYDIFVRFSTLVKPWWVLVDRNPTKQGKTLLNVLRIQSPDILKPDDIDCVVITASNKATQMAIRNDVEKEFPGIPCIDLFPIGE